MEIDISVPCLQDKKYHLFVSSCEEDSDFVLSLVKSLEEKYNIRCLYHARDFIPGESTRQNVLDGMADSLKTLLIITEGFCKSEWCRFEFDTAGNIAVSRPGFIIPAVDPQRNSRGEVDLPWTTYIDISQENEDKICQQILHALKDKGEKKNVINI